jgi:hypothetical protein
MFKIEESPSRIAYTMDILEVSFGIGGWFLVGSLLLLVTHADIQPIVAIMIPFGAIIGIMLSLFLLRALAYLSIWVVHCMFLPSIPLGAFLIFLSGILVQTVTTIRRMVSEGAPDPSNEESKED